jgi:hypothetical protein
MMKGPDYRPFVSSFLIHHSYKAPLRDNFQPKILSIR